VLSETFKRLVNRWVKEIFQCFHEALFGDEMFAGLAHFPGADERGQAVEKAGVWLAAALGLLLLASSGLPHPATARHNISHLFVRSHSVAVLFIFQMSSRAQSPTKRLLTELQTYQSEPNDALVELGPVSDSELTHWTAVMKGVPGTAYEGTRYSLLFVS